MYSSKADEQGSIKIQYRHQYISRRFTTTMGNGGRGRGLKLACREDLDGKVMPSL